MPFARAHSQGRDKQWPGDRRCVADHVAARGAFERLAGSQRITLSARAANHQGQCTVLQQVSSPGMSPRGEHHRLLSEIPPSQPKCVGIGSRPLPVKRPSP